MAMKKELDFLKGVIQLMKDNEKMKEKKTYEQCCWTCDEKKATHKEYRDALGEYEFTCDECHREEYPEQYEDDDE